jgi:hypothetical protein
MAKLKTLLEEAGFIEYEGTRDFFKSVGKYKIDVRVFETNIKIYNSWIHKNEIQTAFSPICIYARCQKNKEIVADLVGRVDRLLNQ